MHSFYTINFDLGIKEPGGGIDNKPGLCQQSIATLHSVEYHKFLGRLFMGAN